MDNCEVEQKEMICNISREKVESFVFFYKDTNETSFDVIYFCLTEIEHYSYLLYASPAIIKYNKKEQKKIFM